MDNHDEFQPHITPVANYLKVFVALFVLLILTMLAAAVDAGYLNTPIAMLIALVKGTLIVLFFMHVRYASPLVRVFAVAGFLWLILMFVLTFSDVLTRH